MRSRLAACTRAFGIDICLFIILLVAPFAGKTISASPERRGPLRKRRKRVIEDNDEEDEDEGPAPSSGEFFFFYYHVHLGLYMNLALPYLSGSQKHRREA